MLVMPVISRNLCIDYKALSLCLNPHSWLPVGHLFMGASKSPGPNGICPSGGRSKPSFSYLLLLTHLRFFQFIFLFFLEVSISIPVR